MPGTYCALFGCRIALRNIGRMPTDQQELDDAEIASRIRSLERELAEPDLARRREAAKALYELCFAVERRAAAAVPALVNCISDVDEDIGESAAWGLKYCSPFSIEPLIGCLGSESASTRRRASSSLGNIGKEAFAAYAPLRALLADPVPEVRERAAWALGLVGDTSAATIDALFAMAQASRPSERSSALHALGNLGRSFTEPTPLQARRSMIMGAVDDKDADVRWSACYVLESLQLEGAEHVRLLMRILKSDDSSRVRSIAVGQLEKLVPTVDLAGCLPVMADVIRRGGTEANEMCRCVASMGPKAAAAAPALIEALDGEGSLALKAAEALWKVTGRADKSLPTLARLFDDFPESVCDVITVMGRAAAPLVDKVIAALEPEDWDLQWAAADALGAIASDNPDVLAALVRALGHPSPIVKSAASRSLANIGPPALPELTRMLADKADGRSEWAADAIGRMGYRAAGAAKGLRDALSDSRAGVRTWSAIALAKVVGDPAVVPALIELLGKTDWPDLQREAAIGLGAIGPGAREALRALEALTSSDDPDVQAAVADAIRAVGAKHN